MYFEPILSYLIDYDFAVGFCFETCYKYLCAAGLPALCVLPWVVARVLLENMLCWTTNSSELLFLIIRGPMTVSILVSMQNLSILYCKVLCTNKQDRICKYKVTLLVLSFLSLRVKFVNSLKKAVKMHLNILCHDLYNAVL